MNALAYLVTRSFANGVLFRLRRLRQPRYLLGAAIGLAYLYLYVGQILGGAHAPWSPRKGTGPPLGPECAARMYEWMRDPEVSRNVGVRAEPLEKLRAAEAAEVEPAAVAPELSPEEKLRRQLDDSKYRDEG